MTLEAALILPLFLFFMLGILSVYDMVLLQSRVSASLFRAGREAAQYAWYARYALDSEEGGAAPGKDSLPARVAAAGLSLAWVSGTKGKSRGRCAFGRHFPAGVGDPY